MVDLDRVQRRLELLVHEAIAAGLPDLEACGVAVARYTHPR